MRSMVYPHSTALTEELSRFVSDRSVPWTTIIHTAIEILSEYEHGSAEVELLELDSISQYKNVLLDYLTYLSTIIELQEEDIAKTNHC